MSAGNTEHFRVIIDGDAPGSEKISASSNVATYVLTSGLADWTHRLELVKETDIAP